MEQQQRGLCRKSKKLMIKYLLDSSVILEFYQPKALFRNFASYKRSLSLRTHISKQRLENKAILFIPSFCVAEVRNKLAVWFYRRKGILKSKGAYDGAFRAFIKHVHDRQFFYCYDLNRYHNLNTNEIVDIEHTTHTEFDVTGHPVGTNPEIINEDLKKKNPYDHIGKYYLSGLDISIIAMGMELKRIHGTEIHLLTADERLALICSKKPDMFPKSYYWHKIKVSDLPRD